MKPIWYIIGMACFLIASIGRMADSLTDVLITVGVIAVVALILWLYENGKININANVRKILKLIAKYFIITFGLLYLIGMALYVPYRVVKTGDMQGIILIALVGIGGGITFYITRWRRRWMRIVKNILPKDKVTKNDLKLRQNYYWVFDYETIAQYGLRPSDGIFDGRARVWLDKQNVEASAKLKVAILEDLLKQNDIVADVKLDHIPGCIYADIVTEANYKTMNRTRLKALRSIFHALDEMNYHGDYYAEYHGEIGTIYFECSGGYISRAIRTEPREEYYLDPDCGFQSEEAYYFISRDIDWTEGIYRLISEKDFYNKWRQGEHYDDKDDAFSFFHNASLMYFAAIANGDKKEQSRSLWEIKNAAAWLRSNNEVETMRELMCSGNEASYWAALLFRDIDPFEATDTLERIIIDPSSELVTSRAQKLLNKWKKEASQ